MVVPQMEPQTVDRLKAMLADQLLVIDQQAQYIQTLIAALEAHDKVAAKVEANGAKART